MLADCGPDGLWAARAPTRNRNWNLHNLRATSPDYPDIPARLKRAGEELPEFAEMLQNGRPVLHSSAPINDAAPAPTRADQPWGRPGIGTPRVCTIRKKLRPSTIAAPAVAARLVSAVLTNRPMMSARRVNMSSAI